jgi:predicted amidophosphoribosyltransferase
LQLPLLHGVTRTRATPPQAELAREERARNVRNAFAVAVEVTGKRLAIVDDVMTSGATADALARCLRRAGAAHVEVWVVARA